MALKFNESKGEAVKSKLTVTNMSKETIKLEWWAISVQDMSTG